MPVEIEYKESVLKDLRKLDGKDALRLVKKLERELRREKTQGAPLKGKFSGLYKLRVGEYRVVYIRTRKGFLVLRIGHRSRVYR